MKGWLKKFFENSVKASTKLEKPKSGGVLGQFDLWDWWYEAFGDEEREYIIKKYNPFPDYPKDKSVLTDGSISIDNPREFLSSLALWFNNPEGFSVALKLMNKAQTYPHSELDILSYHFDCYERITFYYRWRNEHEEALEAAIMACKEQIALAEKAVPVLLEKFSCLPHHTGYEQLAIVYEKQGKMVEAIEICEQGRAQGWANDFEKRLARLKSRLAKLRQE